MAFETLKHNSCINAIGFLPFLTGFLKLTNLDIFSNLVPFTDYNLTFLSGSVNITPLNLFFKFLITLCAFITSLLSFGFVKNSIERFQTLHLCFNFTPWGIRGLYFK